MKVNKKLEILENLKYTMSKNTNAIDYVCNEITRLKSCLKYNPTDEIVQNKLHNLEYIRCTLYYLDEQYMIAFRSQGGRL